MRVGHMNMSMQTSASEMHDTMERLEQLTTGVRGRWSKIDGRAPAFARCKRAHPFHAVPSHLQRGVSDEDYALSRLAAKVLNHIREGDADAGKTAIFSDPLKADRDARKQQAQVYWGRGGLR